MKTRCRNILVLFLVAALTCAVFDSCMAWDYGEGTEDFKASADGLFILNEGNFQYGNATLSYYNPATSEVMNDVFLRANGMKLGDVAQSMTVYGGKGWIVVNNSHVVFAIDTETFKEVGRIENLPSPRYIHFVDNRKAYITQLWDNRIAVADPMSYSITGYIEVPGMDMSSGSTEQMVAFGKYVFCNCWSYQNRIIRIDTTTDIVDAQLEVGRQPSAIALDAMGKLWVLCDGGYPDSPAGYEAPSLWRIDAASLTVERTFRFRRGSVPSELVLDGTGTVLYWLNGGVWRMDVASNRLPAGAFIPERDTRYYGLTVSPDDGDIYVADAIDYQQQGAVYRFTSAGEPLEEFYVGVTPGAFCWK